MKQDQNNIAVWVLAEQADTACLERLGDARKIANAIDCGVGVLWIQWDRPTVADRSRAIDTQSSLLIQHGADRVLVATANVSSDSMSEISTQTGALSVRSKILTTIAALSPYPVKLIIAGGDPSAREWAAMLAAEVNWALVSPALMVQYRAGRFIVTRFDPTGRRSCQVGLNAAETLIVTMRAGVAEAAAADYTRVGEVVPLLVTDPELQVSSRLIPLDPATCDIRDTQRLVAGGRGLGSREGFQLLRQVAESLDAGVAASRMAVDLGWIEYERQVGQTGKTVQPDVYIACGISGASHHLQGIAGAKHLIAINSDPTAPIMKSAHLGLVADLYPVLRQVQHRLRQNRSVPDAEAASVR